MQRQMKRIQKDLARRTAEYSEKGVTVVARGDMTVKSIRIDPDAADLSRPERLSQAVTVAVNGAIKAVKKEAEAEMSKVTKGMDIPGLMGG